MKYTLLGTQMSCDDVSIVNKVLNLNIPVFIMPIHNENNNEIIIYQERPPPPQIHEKYNIMYKHDVDADKKTLNLEKKQGFKAKHHMKHAFNGCSATIDKKLLQELMEDDDILFIEKDQLIEISLHSKEVITQQIKQGPLWHHTITNTVPISTDNFSNVHCYILDTGILPNHSEFSPGQVLLDYNAIAKNTAAEDNNGHGTAVASIVGGKTVGAANKVILHSIKVLNSSGTGYISDIIAGLNWVIANKKTPCVINMSIGGGFSSTLNTAIQKCISNNIQVICSSGNSGVDAGNSSPANTLSAIAVSAYNNMKTKPNWSNYGSVIDTFAPGVDLKAAWGDDISSYFLVNGTSFSSPLTAGIICRYLKEVPNATPSQILSFLSRINVLNEVINPGSNTPNLRIVWNPAKINPC